MSKSSHLKICKVHKKFDDIKKNNYDILSPEAVCLCVCVCVCVRACVRACVGWLH